MTAARAFCEKGYSATTLQDLADVLGVRKSALYHYSSSKEELLFDISRDAMNRSLTRLRGVAQADLPAVEAMREAVSQHIAVLTETLPEHRTMMTEMRSLGDEHRAQIHEMRREYEALFDELIERGVREGVFHSPDRKLTRLAILGTVNWTVYWLDPEQGDVGRVGDVLADFVLRALTGSLPDPVAPDPDRPSRSGP